MAITIDKSLPCHKDLYNQKDKRNIEYIVIHFVGNASVKAWNFAYCNHKKNSNRKASWHYCVGNKEENYKIYQSVPEMSVAWHCGDGSGGIYGGKCTNSNSIGIEHCFYYAAGKAYFEKGTLDASVELVSQLMKEHDIPLDHIIMHFHVSKKDCPKPFLYKDGLWEDYIQQIKEFGVLVDEIIEINGQDVPVKTYTESGVTYVPLRKISEWLGGSVDWVDRSTIKVNGDLVKCDIKYFNVEGNNTAFVPFRGIAVMLGAEVSYDAATKKKGLKYAK